MPPGGHGFRQIVFVLAIFGEGHPVIVLPNYLVFSSTVSKEKIFKVCITAISHDPLRSCFSMDQTARPLDLHYNHYVSLSVVW